MRLAILAATAILVPTLLNLTPVEWRDLAAGSRSDGARAETSSVRAMSRSGLPTVDQGSPTPRPVALRGKAPSARANFGSRAHGAGASRLEQGAATTHSGFGAPAGEPFVYTEWETFTTASTYGGLVNDHIFFLEPDGDSLWIGTERGLVLYHNGEWESWTEEDGLPWNVVMGIAKDQKTGDLWLALFGDGLARFSGGYFQHFNQMNSGLINDVSYGVDIQGDNIWVASTAGISRYNQVDDEWTVFNEKHAPMEEVWAYGVSAGEDKVYFSVWGGGILEWDVERETWKEYVDPDREMEIDLYRDDGLIHVITTSASYIDDVLWASTYFGMSRYDGRNWRGYVDTGSGLPSNFINLAVGRSGTSCYACTDKGLAVLADFESDTWVTYHKVEDDDPTWVAEISNGGERIRSVPTNLDLANDFVLSVEFMGDDVWVGTGHGLARGIGTGYYEGVR